MNFFVLRTVSLMLTLLLTLTGVGACGTPVEERSVQAPAYQVPLGASQEKETALHIVNSQGDIGYLLQQAAETYMRSHPGVRISVQTISGDEQYRLALRQKLQTGEAADLFHVLGRQDAWELRQHLRDLAGLGWVDDAAAGLAEPLHFDTGYYGVPYAIEGYGLIANRNIFEIAGIPLAGIQDYEDLEEALTELRQMINDGDLEEQFPNLQAVTELPLQDQNYIAEILAPILLTGDFADNAHTASTEFIRMPCAEAAQSLLDLLARGCESGKSTGKLLEVPQNLQIELGLAAGRVAIVPQSVRIFSRVEKQNEALANRLALLPVPLEGEEHSGIYVGAPAYWAVNASASPENARTAMNFLTWLYCSEEGVSILAESFRVLSPYRETAKDTGVALHTQLLRYIEQEAYYPVSVHDYPPDWASGILAPGVQQYIGGDTSWEDFTTRCIEQWYLSRKR